MTRRPLDLDDLGAPSGSPEPVDLSVFRPRQAGQGDAWEMARAIDRASDYPRRDPLDEEQINIRASRPLARRFRALCRAERRTYADMLGRLLDQYGEARE
jgi:hypothetical protein